MERERLRPGPDHPITVTPADRRVTVRVGDTVVAETSRALVLQEASYPGVYYLPLDDVDPALLSRTDTSTYCPYKGEASYYSLVTPTGELTDTVWTYEQPYDDVAGIAGHVAFYPDRVETTTSDL